MTARLMAIVSSTLIVASMCLGSIPASADDAAQAAARAAEEKYGGRVLKVELRDGVYRVKLLQPSGKVKVVKMPAPEGASGDSRDNEAKSRQSRREPGGGR